MKNDGRGRLGGRAKGTPNRVTGTVREWLSGLIDRNRKQMEADLATLDPKTRLFMLEKLLLIRHGELPDEFGGRLVGYLGLKRAFMIGIVQFDMAGFRT